MEDPAVPFERNQYGHPLAGLLWERQFEKVLLQYGWGKVPNWECLFVNREKRLFLSAYVCDIKRAGKTENINPTWNILMKDVDLGETTSFLDHVYVGCTQKECQTNKDIVDNYRSMFESRISAGAMEKLQETKNYKKQKPQGNLMPKRYLHGPMTWKVMQRNAWKDIGNWRMKLRNNFAKSRHRAWMTVNSEKKKLDQLDICPQYAHKLSTY